MRLDTSSPRHPHILAIERSYRSLEELLGDVRERGELIEIDPGDVDFILHVESRRRPVPASSGSSLIPHPSSLPKAGAE